MGIEDFQLETWFMENIVQDYHLTAIACLNQKASAKASGQKDTCFENIYKDW